MAKARADAQPEPPGRERPRTPPRRGGARQRLDAQLGKADDAKVTKPTVGDMFKTLLGRLMLANKVSAVDTQSLAQSADEAGSSGAHGLAKAGKYGQTIKNAHRDVQWELLKGVTVPEPYYAEVRHTSASRNQQLCYAYLKCNR